MRRPWLALAWPEAQPDAADRAGRLRAELAAAGGWDEAFAAAGLSAWRPADAGAPLRPLGGGGLLVGDLFPRPGAAARPPDRRFEPAPPRRTAARLAREAWGRYVALLPDPGRGGWSAFRDPSGSVGCVTWPLGGGVVLAASDLTHVPAGLRPRHGFLDWARIAALLAAPAVATIPALFDEVTAVPPGGLLALTGTARPELVWDPAAFAGAAPADLAAAAEELVARVDVCAADLLAGHERLLVELSGGLDSSIVAGALGATGAAARVAAWLNYRDARPEADESRYARAVTARLGVPLTTPRGWAAPIDAAALAEIGRWAWPAIGGIDAGRDRDELARLRQASATALVSGQGGDGVFFQVPTALVLADALGRDGWRALASPLPAALARRTRQSVWQVLGQAWAARRGRARWPRTVSRLVSDAVAEAGAAAAHPWTAAARAAGLPPAKVLHVHGVAVTHLYTTGPSRRAEAAELVLPLFAQPVVELCLRLAVPDLAGESTDRPFARRAFARRLPEPVRLRRSKGDMSTYYGRLVAMSLPTLRPYLLDGCLAAAGLLDRARLLATLDPAALLRGGAGSAMDVLNAAAVEAWVRHWQTQVPDAPTGSRWAVAG